MRKENYVDGLLYELRNPQYDENGQVISTEISARSNGWNIYSDSSERMMNMLFSTIITVFILITPFIIRLISNFLTH